MIRLPPGIEIGRSSIGTIMSNVLNFRKVCARWVPRLLSENHKQQRMETARAFLEMHRRDGDQLFSRIVTGYESWEHHSTPETKRQSMVWKKPEESAPKKAKVTISAGKVMAIVFWDSESSMNIQKFDGNNFTSWKFRIICILEGKDLNGFIKEDPPKDEKITVEWKRKDAQARGIITCAMDDTQVSEIGPCVGSLNIGGSSVLSSTKPLHKAEQLCDGTLPNVYEHTCMFIGNILVRPWSQRKNKNRSSHKRLSKKHVVLAFPEDGISLKAGLDKAGYKGGCHVAHCAGEVAYWDDYFYQTFKQHSDGMHYSAVTTLELRLSEFKTKLHLIPTCSGLKNNSSGIANQKLNKIDFRQGIADLVCDLIAPFKEELD
ncbi:hypothetical protein LAZ67_2002942 [Cordylochernes scorpioides]|uniref:Uncharacterized protein n=1 Tax=Cordylochernes scorpioides TaxID=51811 RepID=A0ABY6K2M4_9ARAC|nr:hypothetical protein LAZ67_2002942 [Cordylochernes scorpioides]